MSPEQQQRLLQLMQEDLAAGAPFELYMQTHNNNNNQFVQHSAPACHGRRDTNASVPL